MTSGTRTAVRAGSSRGAPARKGRTPVAAEPRRGRRWWWWVVLGLVVVVSLAAAAAFSPLLDVESVEVSGAAPDRMDAVREAAGIEVGDSIVAFLPGTVAGRVRALPWVAEARVVRDLPDIVRIEVVPRVAVGWTEVGTKAVLVDADSRVIAKADVPPPGVPELVGLDDVGPVGGTVAPRALPAAAGALGSELRVRIASLTLADGSLTAALAGGPELRFGSPGRLSAKARVAAAVLAGLGDRPAAYIDVGVPAAPVSG